MEDKINGDLEFTDNPIQNTNDDFFQRSEFANRISSLLLKKKQFPSFSLGIYGRWGEGKTSILNLIKRNLRNSSIEIIDFNPWMFSSEEQLLIMFFSILHSKLNTLKTTKAEVAGQKMKDFSALLGTAMSFTGLSVGATIKDIGSKLADKSLEERKNEINAALQEENKRFVFILDDLDRLNSDELFAIFRLIKLTGDFNNISYILAFDDKIVANMLSKRFSGEGESYLEKIIQLPLKIPKAQDIDLSKYFFTKLNELFANNNFKPKQYDLDEIRRSFNLYILPFLDIPRFVVRLMNALEFIFPMLKNQVNLPDLILLEWIKLKYPKVYLILRENYSLLHTNFSEKQSSVLDFSKPTYEKEDLKNKLKPILEKLSSFEARQVINSIIKLFPRTKSGLTTDYYTEIDFKEKYLEKRACSPDYSERYFTLYRFRRSNFRY